MPRAAQALPPRFPSGSPPGGVKSALLMAVILALPACASGKFSMKQAEVDRSLYTNSVPATTSPVDALRQSDEATIRNAVSSADIDSLAGAPVPWSNAETGARGSITGLAEYREDGVLCRRFTTTRESFDGVLMLKGQACLDAMGGWRMTGLDSL